jgi:iron-sulfur cluster repair protein YtfE (RIC family)
MTITLTPDTSVLELVEHHPETEAVFERYTKRLGICICCECLFCSLKDVAARYELDLDELMARLNSAIESDLKESPCA